MDAKRLAPVCAISVFCMSACYTYDHSAGPFNANDGDRMSKSWGDSRCEDGGAFVAALDAGLAKLESLRPEAEGIRAHLGVWSCATPEAVSCVFGNYVVDGSVPPPPGVQRRYAGCAGMGSVWFLQAAKHYPPVCRAEWPDEPHCVATADAIERQAYSQGCGLCNTAAHELINLFAQYSLGILVENDPALVELHDQSRGSLWDQMAIAIFNGWVAAGGDPTP